MRCNRCGGKGYLEEEFAVSNSFSRIIKQCCDIAAYSKRVQDLSEMPIEYDDPEPPRPRRRESACPVIPFRRP